MDIEAGLHLGKAKRFVYIGFESGVGFWGWVH